MLNTLPRQDPSMKIRVESMSGRYGDTLTTGFHHFFLFAIGATIVWSSLLAFWAMIQKGDATIEDILLLFIYLELGAMIGVYFKTDHMPVRFLIYVAITALTRLLISMVFVDHTPDMRIVIVSGSILVLSIGILILKIGSHKFPSHQASNATDFEDGDNSV